MTPRNCILIVAFFLVFTFTQFTYSQDQKCISRIFNSSSIVCVCNATYCDTMEPLGDIPNNKYYHVVSTRSGLRFDTSMKDKSYDDDGGDGRAELWIDRRLQYQKMIGFGGAFTDATGINMLTLPKALQDNIMNSYFGQNGLEYNVMRVPIGGADFSDRSYTLCDLDDPEATDPDLINFALQPDDHNYKIPFIKQAQEIRPDMKLFASPWSPPIWMKSNNKFTGFGHLRPEFYGSYSKYLLRFLEEYKKQDVEFWAITVQNEPTHGLLIAGKWNSMGWTPQQQRDFIKANFGPDLRKSDFNQTKLIMMDDQRFSVVYWSQVILGDPESAQYVDGIGLHWYANPYIPPFPLNIAHNEFPDYFMINTEACTGYLHFIPGIPRVLLGSWERAELYAHNIIEDLNHWLTGWVEWNLILDMSGGPNWATNRVDAPIIVDKDAGEAYKQPMFYALGHFTKYVSENSIRVSNSGKEMRSLQVLSVLRPDDKIVLVVYNSADKIVPLRIRDSLEEGSILVDIQPKSINTIVYSVTEPTGGNEGSAGVVRIGIALLSSMILFGLIATGI